MQQMLKPKFEMVTGRDGRYMYRLLSAHGNPLLIGRGYVTQYEAIQAISYVMRYGPHPNRYAKKATPDGQHFFLLQSPSGRVIGSSVYYRSSLGRDNAIVAVRRAVQAGKVHDLN